MVDAELKMINFGLALRESDLGSKIEEDWYTFELKPPEMIIKLKPLAWKSNPKKVDIWQAG